MVLLMLYLNTFLNISEASFPITYINNARNNGWIAEGIKISHLRKGVYTFSLDTVMNQNLNYIIIGTVLFFTKSNQTGKKLYFNCLTDVCDNQMKTTWNIIKKCKRESPDHMSTSFKNDNAQVLPDKAAGTFNNHILNITESLNKQNIKDNPPI